MGASVVTVAGLYVALFILERRHPLRRSTESKWRRQARNLAVAGLTGAAFQVAECPAVTPLARAVNHHSLGLLPALRLPRLLETCLAVALLRGEEPSDWRTSLYIINYEGLEGDHKVARHEGVATERYKLIHFYELGEWEFYDLRMGPTEVRNRYDDPAVAPVLAGLKDELKRLREFYDVPPDDAIPRTERRPMGT
ncbi:MAG: sulfatase/phosphatase domain-containing protein, partial [Opitutaceae bacterium]